MRSTKKIIYKGSGDSIAVGPFTVKQPLPVPQLKQVSPFLLLHHAGPHLFKAGSKGERLSPHPHRGFEPVTFLFKGRLHHRDSAGNEGLLQDGDVQWMTAGSGIIHSEGPTMEFQESGGTLELVQLWVNLPREHKMTTPRYQDIRKAQMPLIVQPGFTASLVAGVYGALRGPAQTFTPMLAMTAEFEKDGVMDVEIPAGFNTIVYVLDGSLTSVGSIIDAGEMAVMDVEGETLQLQGKQRGRLLLLAGEPINEPVVSYGPFVMNVPGEIKQAILDYESGKMGVLEQ